MSKFAVIVQNDESKWDDIKGELYNYPRRYKEILSPGCRVIYYKGKMTNRAYIQSRMSPEPHYFGAGVIGESIENTDSPKREAEFYCEILNYREFDRPILAKQDGSYLEPIPESKETNYWRYGVREIDETTFNRILALAALRIPSLKLPSESDDLESFSPMDGTKKQRYSTHYERNPYYRNRAIAVHGVTCMGCGFNFEANYGEWGRGYVHVHHKRPISESGPTPIDPANDLCVLCPNCHSMVHRKKDRTLSLEELRQIIRR